MRTYTLFELNEYIRRVLALNLPDALWVTGELAQVDQSRGQWYFSLIQKAENEGDIIAQMPAILWQNTFRQLRFRLGPSMDSILREGIEVRLKVRLDYHERYGLKLIVEELDPDYTLGRLAAQRQLAIEKLKAEAWIGRNAAIPLPPAIQRIAVLSSATAAGYQDFIEQLHNNPYGYAFQVVLLPSAVQGQQVLPDMSRHLARLKERSSLFDCVVIIRGGGARTDLAAFDQYELGKLVAQCPLPVLTGIGHETDMTVVDIVAHQSLKTPTAVAEFIIQYNTKIESQLLATGRQIQRQAQWHIHTAQQKLGAWRQEALLATRHLIGVNGQQIEQLAKQLPLLAKRQLEYRQRDLNQLEKISHLLSIEATLQRGFTLTTQQGKPANLADLKPGDRLMTRFKDGAVESTVD